MADHKLNSKVSNEDNRNNKEKKQLMSNNKIKWSSIINPNHTPAITMVDAIDYLRIKDCELKTKDKK